MSTCSRLLLISRYGILLVFHRSRWFWPKHIWLLWSMPQWLQISASSAIFCLNIIIFFPYLLVIWIVSSVWHKVLLKQNTKNPRLYPRNWLLCPPPPIVFWETTSQLSLLMDRAVHINSPQTLCLVSVLTVIGTYVGHWFKYWRQLK